MKKSYEKPSVTSEPVLETLAAGCTFMSAADDGACDPDFGGQELNPGS